MKKVFIILVFLLLVGGGAAAAYFMGFLDGLLNLGSSEEMMMEDAMEEPDVIFRDPTFYSMDSLYIPVIRGSSVAKTVVIGVTLEVMDPDAVETLDQLRPRLRADFLRALQRYIGTLSLGERVDLRVVKVLLRKTAEKILGKGVVTDVLVQNAVEER